MKKLIFVVFVLFLGVSCNQVTDLSDELDSVKAQQVENAKKIQELEERNKELQSTIDSMSGASANAKVYSDITGLTLDHTYVGEYDKFLVSSEGYVQHFWGPEPTDMATQGYIEKLILPEGYAGCIAIVKTDHHTNWGHFRYPDYNETDSDSGENCSGTAYCHDSCYVAFYIRPEGDGFYMAQAIWNDVDGHEQTACTQTLDQILYLFKTYGYAKTCDNRSSSYTRSVRYMIEPHFPRGIFY